MLREELESVKAHARIIAKEEVAAILPGLEKRLDTIEKRLRKLEAVPVQKAEKAEPKAVEPKVVKKK